METESLKQIKVVLVKIKSVFESAHKLLENYDQYLKHNYQGSETTETHTKLLNVLRAIEEIERKELNTEYREDLLQLVKWQKSQMQDLLLLERVINAMQKNESQSKNAEDLIREFISNIENEIHAIK